MRISKRVAGEMKSGPNMKILLQINLQAEMFMQSPGWACEVLHLLRWIGDVASEPIYPILIY
jgi:hypothetical protein